MRSALQDIAVTEGADRTFWAATWGWAGQSVGGYVGLQQGAPKVGGIGGEVAIFSIWNPSAAQGSHCQAFEGEGTGLSCRTRFKFRAGRYHKLRVERSEGSEEATRWWTASIQDTTSGKTVRIGSLETPEAGDHIGTYVNFTEYFGTAVAKPFDVPESEAMYTQPAANRTSLSPLAYQYYSAFTSSDVGSGTTANVGQVRVRGTVATRVLMGGKPSGRLRRCGYVDETVAVAGLGLRCKQAKSIARRYVAGKSKPSGYRCTRYSVRAAAGFFAICRKGGRQVRVVPE